MQRTKCKENTLVTIGLVCSTYEQHARIREKERETGNKEGGRREGTITRGQARKHMKSSDG